MFFSDDKIFHSEDNGEVRYLTAQEGFDFLLKKINDHAEDLFFMKQEIYDLQGQDKEEK